MCGRCSDVHMRGKINRISILFRIILKHVCSHVGGLVGVVPAGLDGGGVRTSSSSRLACHKYEMVECTSSWQGIISQLQLYSVCSLADGEREPRGCGDENQDGGEAD